MSREAYLNVGRPGAVRPAGVVRDWPALCAWVRSLPETAGLSALIADEPADAATVEQELARALVKAAGELDDPDAQRAAEELLLAVLGRPEDAHDIGTEGALPLPEGQDWEDPEPFVMRAAQVTAQQWNDWPPERQRRQFLLVKLCDLLADPDDDNEEEDRQPRLAAMLMALHPSR